MVLLKDRFDALNGVPLWMCSNDVTVQVEEAGKKLLRPVATVHDASEVERKCCERLFSQAMKKREKKLHGDMEETREEEKQKKRLQREREFLRTAKKEQATPQPAARAREGKKNTKAERKIKKPSAKKKKVLRTWVHRRQTCSPPPGSYVTEDGRTVVPSKPLPFKQTPRRRSCSPSVRCDRDLRSAPVRVASRMVARCRLITTVLNTTAKNKLRTEILQSSEETSRGQLSATYEEDWNEIYKSFNTMRAISKNIVELEVVERFKRNVIIKVNTKHSLAVCKHLAVLGGLYEKSVSFVHEEQGKRDGIKDEEARLFGMILTMKAHEWSPEDIVLHLMKRENAKNTRRRLEARNEVRKQRALFDKEAMWRYELSLNEAANVRVCAFLSVHITDRMKVQRAAFCMIHVVSDALLGYISVHREYQTSWKELKASERQLRAFPALFVHDKKQLLFNEKSARQQLAMHEDYTKRLYVVEYMEDSERHVVCSVQQAQLNVCLLGVMLQEEDFLRVTHEKAYSWVRKAQLLARQEILQRQFICSEAYMLPSCVRVMRNEAAHRKLLYQKYVASLLPLLLQHEHLSRHVMEGLFRAVIVPTPSVSVVLLLCDQEAASRILVLREHRDCVKMLRKKGCLMMAGADLLVQHKSGEADIALFERRARELSHSLFAVTCREHEHRLIVERKWFQPYVGLFSMKQFMLSRLSVLYEERLQRWGFDVGLCLLGAESSGREALWLTCVAGSYRIGTKALRRRERLARDNIIDEMYVSFERAVLQWSHEGKMKRLEELECLTRNELIKGWHGAAMEGYYELRTQALFVLACDKSHIKKQEIMLRVKQVLIWTPVLEAQGRSWITRCEHTMRARLPILMKAGPRRSLASLPKTPRAMAAAFDFKPPNYFDDILRKYSDESHLDDNYTRPLSLFFL